MSNVVILCGSVRKDGNTDLLAKAFAKGAEQNNTVEIISVADCKVNPCVGCNSCFSKEGNECFQQDDMAKIYKSLANADVIAVASPVYFYGLSAQLKAIIDRLHNPIRDTFKTKKLALLLVAGASLPAVFDSILVQYRLIIDYFHLESLGEVLVREVRHIGDIKDNPALNDAYNLGKSI
jgi:multimeric flavodoxin WrbA